MQDSVHMHRDDLLERFRGTPALRDAGRWYQDAQILLGKLELCLRGAELQRDETKHVLWLQVLRIRRYFLALSVMTIQGRVRIFV